MNTKYLVASHGHFASGIQSSINILTNQGDKLKVIDAYVDDSDYTQEIDEFVESIESDEYGVIFTDLYGGSVNQRVTSSVVSHQKQQHITIVTNANLSTVLTVMMMTETPTIEQVEKLLEETQVKVVPTQVESSDDEDFFD
ncbi:PTS mannose transporter subunit IIA [Dolosicoccus paucivorans]|uniref:PTS mannose transporter subunit IIA n=1 Tax=Dolosicoccus paucivorans TaxID=84521 RepID=A0A2N6SLH2_9LACT|nr:PTS mannose transporter subunit IIA [Dolosicoccus paucivorans]PMC57896.1 PTS mannose transporter subunit IIA [Dolosicoccus paucivorans]